MRPVYILLSTDYYTCYDGWTRSKKKMQEHANQWYTSALRIRAITPRLQVDFSADGETWEKERPR